MKKYSLKKCPLILIILTFGISSVLFSQTSEEYRKRRKDVLSRMEPGSSLILKNYGVPRSASTRTANNNFYYLTGLSEAESALVLTKGRRNREILFLRDVDMSLANWEALSLGIEGAKDKLGFTDVRLFESFNTFIGSSIFSRPGTVYMDYERSRGLDSPLTRDEMIFKTVRDRGIDLDIRPASNLVFPMRRVKSDSEIDIITKAVKISSEAHKEMMRSAEPGMYEYQLQGIGEYVFKFNGAQQPGYSSIVGSGINGCVLHWSENSRKMEDGDMVVIDMGCFYEYYTADITRSFPVNGKFTDRQKQIYEIVLAANEGAIEMIRPGVSWGEISARARKIIADGLMDLGMIESPMEVRKYYMHGLGHNIGLHVHDVGGIGTLEPGMILTIEPGIYIREESMGIRIEDDVLVTEDGYKILSADCPKKIDDVEKMMAEKGMDFKRYMVKK